MLSIGDTVEYQGDMYKVDCTLRTHETLYHLEGMHPAYLIKRRHLRKYPLTGLSGQKLRDAVHREPPTYEQAIKRILQAGLTMQDINIIAKVAVP